MDKTVSVHITYTEGNSFVMLNVAEKDAAKEISWQLKRVGLNNIKEILIIR